MSKIQRLKLQADGAWELIAASLAPSLSEALKHTGRHVSCPVHGGIDGFRLFKDFNSTGGGVCNSCGSFTDGISLLMWVNDAPIKEVLNGIDETLNGVSPKELKQYRKTVVAKSKKLNEEAKAKAKARLKRVWAESLTYSSESEAAKKSYLESRGLPSELSSYLADTGFHGGLAHWSYNKATKKMDFKGKHPALMSLVRRNDTGKALTIHRAYMESHAGGFKKADGIPKTVMSPNDDWSSCAIRLGERTDKTTLNIAEGIETSLAVIAMGERHCWSVISTGNLSKFTPPKGVKKIVVWADLDENKAGSNACLALSNHLQSVSPEIEVVAVFPPLDIPSGSKGVDWLDFYNRHSTKAA